MSSVKRKQWNQTN